MDWSESRMIENKTTNINKMQHTIIKQKFFNQFYLFNGISKSRSQKNKEENSNLTPTVPVQDSNFEEEVIENQKCDQNWPICLYDFTFKLAYPHSHKFRAGGSSLINIIETHIPEVPQAE